MQRSSSTVSRRNESSPFSFTPQNRLRPLVHAIALMLAAGATVPAAHAQRAFSGAWMAQKNMAQSTALATGRLPNGMPASALVSPQAQQQRAAPVRVTAGHGDKGCDGHGTLLFLEMDALRPGRHPRVLRAIARPRRPRAAAHDRRSGASPLRRAGTAA